ncbi:Tigger transposable element-derived protein 4 [Trichinella papuae]|uniref:Tigger transposable element-derived protein 4 n=1 Tax=Trichinella papuae TaxID=268474 RepID=A0A0V1MJ49_9BILA|nr:Tigger transposable element-derived protein 4 [Trichinella papuae]
MSHNCGYVTNGAEQMHVVLMLHYSFSHYIASALMSKRIALSVKGKVAVVSALNNAHRQYSQLVMDICSLVCRINNYRFLPSFDHGRNTTSSIWKNQSALLDAHENTITSRKKSCLCEKTDIDEALLQWFREQSEIRTPISGPILKIKAEQFATVLGYSE